MRGLDGTNDAGQMSASYVFAAMGLYPLDPISGKYQLCSPLFDKIIIRLPNKKIAPIVGHKSSGDAMYIDR